MDALMNVKEAAVYLRLNYMTVYKLVQKGAIPASKIGGNWRFKKEILDDWLIRESGRGRGSVLVVDDEPEICDILSDMISKHGYTVVTASNGEKALYEVKQRHFDLIFLDLVLPGANGVEVMQRIKDSDSDAVVVIVTGFGDDPLAVMAMSLGPLLIVRKPFREKDIVEVLNLAMKGRKVTMGQV